MKMLSKKDLITEIKQYYHISDKDFDRRLEKVRDYINLDTRDIPTKYISHDYKNVDYIYGSYCCYTEYSRIYLKILESKILPQTKWKIKSVLDMGAGCGITTMKLRSLFPKAEMYYNQIRGTEQWKFAKHLDKKYKLKFNYIDETEVYHHRYNIDLVVAGDFFEHIYEALDLSRAIIRQYSPKYWLIANAFRLPHPDHLIAFKYGDRQVSNTKISKLFNKQMRELGYEIHPLTRSLWNSRPTFWIKNEKNI